MAQGTWRVNPVKNRKLQQSVGAKVSKAGGKSKGKFNSQKASDALNQAKGIADHLTDKGQSHTETESVPPSKALTTYEDHWHSATTEKAAGTRPGGYSSPNDNT